MEEERAKKNNGEGIDRLSNLPESLLLHILSFLPTRTCVNTISLVSHRYRYLWQDLQVLNVKDEDFQFQNLDDVSDDEVLFRYLSLFVNAFLTRRKSRPIHKFRLSFDLSDLDKFSALYVDNWIRTVIGPHLQELHLSIFYDDNYLDFPLNLLSSCPKLVSLSLCGDFGVEGRLSSWAVYLPLLKKLIIDSLLFVEVPVLDKLLSCCPILEILEVSIGAESLATLRVPHSLKRLKFTSKNDIGTCLEIDAPDLKYLSLTIIELEEGSPILNLHKHKMDEVYLDVVSLPCENLLRLLSKIKHLVFGASTTKWLFDVEFPEFQHLIHLELNLPCSNISFLYQVLQKCPLLQALIIKKFKDPLSHSHLHLSAPKKVPNCLVSHLTFIHFKGFQRNRDELSFIEYVLQKGLVLKTMHISCLSFENDIILKQLSNTPKGSVSCQLKIDLLKCEFAGHDFRSWQNPVC